MTAYTGRIYEPDDRELFCKHCGRARWRHIYMPYVGYVCRAQGIDTRRADTERLGPQGESPTFNGVQPMSDRAAITDADRRAAAACAKALDVEDWATGGGYFAAHLCQAFAAYRIQARKEAIEEAAVWLECRSDMMCGSEDAVDIIDELRDAAAAIRALGEGVEPLTPAPE